MKIKNTILALVIVAVLGGLLYYVSSIPEKPAKDAIPKENLFSFQPDQIEEFTLEASSQPAATIQRAASTAPAPAAPKPDSSAAPKAGPNASEEKSEEKKDAAPQWQITAPEGVAADSAQIQTFLEEIAGLQAAPLKGDAAPNWSEYGLDKPDRSYRFKLKDGKTVALDIGQENPGAYARYARRDNAAPLLLMDNIDDKSLIEKTLFDLRDKRILPISLEQSKRIELHFDLSGQNVPAEELAKAKQLGIPTKAARIVLTKQASGNWDLDEPHVRTDPGNSQYVMSTISGGTMRSLEEEKPASLAKYGLDRPQIRLDVITPSGTQSLLVGKKDKKGEEEFFYAKNTVWPSVFTILRTVYDQLNQDMEAYRERYLFGFDEATVHSVDILGPQGAMRFGHRGEDWFAAASPQTQNKELKLEGTKMQNFLSSLHALRIASYTTDEPNRFVAYGLDKPWMTAKVTYGEKNQVDTVVFARKDKKFYAGRQGEPSVYELSPNEPDNLEAKLKELTAPPAPPPSASTSAAPTSSQPPAPAAK